MPDDVAKQDAVKQYSPSKTIDDCRCHASNLKFTNWRSQRIGEVTQVLDPGVDVSDECSVLYPAAEIPRVEVTASNASKDCWTYKK